MTDFEFRLTVMGPEYKNSRDYETRDTLAQLDLPLPPELAWELYRYCVERVTTPTIVITEPS